MGIAVQRPSFLRSMGSGMAGFAKGALAGGMVGAVGGAIIGALIGLTGGLAAAGAVALLGAAIGGGAFGIIGALSGTMTGVVQSREDAQIERRNVQKAVKVAFAQGLAVGLSHQQQQEHEPNKWVDKIDKEQSQKDPTLVRH